MNDEWGLRFCQLLAQQACEAVVDGVAGACGGDVSVDTSAYECHVADDVEEFVACGLVVPHQGLCLNVA